MRLGLSHLIKGRIVYKTPGTMFKICAKKNQFVRIISLISLYYREKFTIYFLHFR